MNTAAVRVLTHFVQICHPQQNVPRLPIVSLTMAVGLGGNLSTTLFLVSSPSFFVTHHEDKTAISHYKHLGSSPRSSPRVRLPDKIRTPN